MKALLLIDIQNDFTPGEPGGALAVTGGNEVVPVANRLMPGYDLVVATQDWHPADHGSFASRHPGRTVGDAIDLYGLPQMLWPDHCVQGTPGAAFCKGLDIRGIHAIIRKGTDRRVDSYSGFFDNGPSVTRRATGLAGLLREYGVDEVDLVGLATDYCVKATAIDAAEQGFQTRVILEGTRGVDLQPGDIDRAIETMRDAGVEIVHSNQLLMTELVT